jgi:Tfp pilus assembly protein PilF
MILLAVWLATAGCDQTHLAEEPYRRGLGYLDTHEYDKAVAVFTQAIEKDPEHGDAFFYRGMAYRWKSNHEQAI